MNKSLAFGGAGFAFVAAAAACVTAAQTVGIGAVVAGLTLFGVGVVAAFGLGLMCRSLQSNNAGAAAWGSGAAALLGAAVLLGFAAFDPTGFSTTVNGALNYVLG